MKNLITKALGIAGIVGGSLISGGCEYFNKNEKIITGEIISEATETRRDGSIGSSYAIKSKEGVYVDVSEENYSDIFNVGDNVELKVKKGRRIQTGTKLNDYEYKIIDNNYRK